MGAAGGGAAVGLMAAGTIIGALGQVQAGAYNQAMAEYDAQQLDAAAKDAIARGEEDAAQLGKDAGRLISTQRAAGAGQGIDVNTGTAAQIQQDTLAMSDRDIRTVRLNAMREARGIRTQAASTRANGRMGVRTANYQAGGSLLTGGAQAVAMATQTYNDNKAAK